MFAKCFVRKDSAALKTGNLSIETVLAVASELQNSPVKEATVVKEKPGHNFVGVLRCMQW